MVTCSKSMVLHVLEGLVIRNTHAKFENPISYDKQQNRESTEGYSKSIVRDITTSLVKGLVSTNKT